MHPVSLVRRLAERRRNSAQVRPELFGSIGCHLRRLANGFRCFRFYRPSHLSSNHRYHGCQTRVEATSSSSLASWVIYFTRQFKRTLTLHMYDVLQMYKIWFTIKKKKKLAYLLSCRQKRSRLKMNTNIIQLLLFSFVSILNIHLMS